MALSIDRNGINTDSFQKELQIGGGQVEGWDPYRGLVAKISRVGNQYLISPTESEKYPIDFCDAVVNWATLIVRRHFCDQ